MTIEQLEYDLAHAKGRFINLIITCKSEPRRQRIRYKGMGLGRVILIRQSGLQYHVMAEFKRRDVEKYVELYRRTYAN